MKNAYMFLILFLIVGAISCESSDNEEKEDTADEKCFSNEDCRDGKICDTDTGICVEDNEEDNGNTGFPDKPDDNGDENDEKTESDDSDNEKEQPDDDPVTGDCEPGDIKDCEYSGPPETEGVGVCKAAQALCLSDGTWGPCEGEVLPSVELCDSGLDENCDGIVDNCDLDDPDEFELEDCDDSAIAPDSSDAFVFAQAMEICSRDDEYGITAAEFLMPDGSCCPKNTSYKIISSFGNHIVPREGSYMLAISSGEITVPFTSDIGMGQNTSSAPPADWFEANDEKFPTSPDCEDHELTDNSTINDPVMFEIKLKTPPIAKGVEFNINFLTFEYPKWVCSEYNDFFVTLLDSEYTSDDPEMQNPGDKNLARDENGNQVGVNLAPSGLFKICPVGDYPGCEGDAELEGSGLEQENEEQDNSEYGGGTGWLLTRGNVLPDEEITLRFAIWDTGDHMYDSIVLIDNFKWLTEEVKPGTGDM
ncbi:MAG: choice-of-anchor L domain-containing protein [bacterium]